MSLISGAPVRAVRRPLVIELFAGTWSWSRGWLELGGRAVLFDIDHQPYHGPIPSGAELVLQDVRTLDGRQFKDADLILASPPCQEFSYMAMPWTRAKQIAAALRGGGRIRGTMGNLTVETFPEGYAGSRTIAELTALFDACFHIQREASAAAGRHIPMVVENVNGAQPWVGRARWHYGSYYFWGDVPALMPFTRRQAMMPSWRHPNDPRHVPGLGLNTVADRQTKNAGGSWFNVAHNTTSGHGQNPDGRLDGVKVPGRSGPAWFDETSKTGSKSSARKAASARIAMLPEALSRHIAQCYWPRTAQGVAP